MYNEKLNVKLMLFMLRRDVCGTENLCKAENAMEVLCLKITFLYHPAYQLCSHGAEVTPLILTLQKRGGCFGQRQVNLTMTYS